MLLDSRRRKGFWRRIFVTSFELVAVLFLFTVGVTDIFSACRFSNSDSEANPNPPAATQETQGLSVAGDTEPTGAVEEEFKAWEQDFLNDDPYGVRLILPSDLRDAETDPAPES